MPETYLGKPIGLEKLTWFPMLTDVKGGETTYGPAVKIARAINAKLTPEQAEGLLESDNAVEDQVRLLTGIAIEFVGSQLSNEVFADIFGHEYDEKGGVTEAMGDTAPWGALAFKAMLSVQSGKPKYAYIVMYKGRLYDFPEDFDTQKKGQVDFKLHTVQGNFVPRESDGRIRYRIREDDAKFDAAMADAWFTTPQVKPVATP